MAVLGVGMAANPAQNSFLLQSPNGKYKVLLKATDECAGIWVSGDDTGSMVTLVNDQEKGSIVGVYGPKLDGKTWKSLDVAFSANKDGGYIMLANPDQSKHKFITGK